MKIKTPLFLLGLGLAMISPAAGAVSMTFTEDGGNVVLTYSGTLDFGTITSQAELGVNNSVNPSQPSFALGLDSVTDTDRYVNIIANNPIPIYGTGGATAPTTSTGTIFEFAPGGLFLDEYIAVPRGYVNNDPIAGQSVFNGETFASMGLAPGVTTYDLTTGDSISITVVEPVPEPSTALLGLLGAAALLRRKR